MRLCKRQMYPFQGRNNSEYCLKDFHWKEELQVPEKDVRKVYYIYHKQGRIQDFKLGEAYLKKSRRAEGGAKIVGVFHLKNHDFTQKKSYFFQF